MGSVRWAAIAGVAFLAACATTERGTPAYRPVVGGRQAIYLTGYTQVRQPAQPPYFVPSQTITLVPVEDAQCTLRNDKGAWVLGPQGAALAAVAATGILIGAVAAGSVIGSEASARAAGPEGRDTCDYAITSIAVYLWPEER